MELSLVNIITYIFSPALIASLGTVLISNGFNYLLRIKNELKYRLIALQEIKLLIKRDKFLLSLVETGKHDLKVIIPHLSTPLTYQDFEFGNFDKILISAFAQYSNLIIEFKLLSESEFSKPLLDKHLDVYFDYSNSVIEIIDADIKIFHEIFSANFKIFPVILYLLNSFFDNERCNKSNHNRDNRK